MFPIYILDKDTKLPTTGTYYIVSRNGIYLHKDTGLIQATVRVDRISSLEELTPSVTLRMPKLPPELLVRSLLFFRTARHPPLGMSEHRYRRKSR